MYPKPPNEHLKKRYSRYLSKDERVVVITGVSNRYFWSKFILQLPLAFLLIGLPSLVNLIHHKRSLTYILTNRRFLIIQGIFTRKLITAPLEAVTHVTVEQSVSERYFYNSGQLVIITAGYDQREIVIENISDPVDFKILMEELTSQLSQAGNVNFQNQEQFSGQLRSLKIG